MAKIKFLDVNSKEDGRESLEASGGISGLALISHANELYTMGRPKKEES